MKARKTVKEADYSGPVYYSDRYYADLESLRDELAVQGYKLDDDCKVFACDVERFQLDCDEIVEREFNDFVENMEDEFYTPNKVSGLDELKAAIEAFNAKQTFERWEDNGTRIELELGEKGGANA